MSSWEISGSQPTEAPKKAGGLENLGLWLMGAYWLAMLGVFVVGGS